MSWYGKVLIWAPFGVLIGILIAKFAAHRKEGTMDAGLRIGG
jgi:hypothetical protein